MKKYIYCGLDNPDEALQCGTCHTGLDPQSKLAPPTIGQGRWPDEHHAWEKLTLRPFAIFFVRLQAMCFLFYGVESASYLPSYLSRLHESYIGSTAYSQASHAFFWALFRVILHVAGALACIQYAERIVDWIGKDLIPKVHSV